MAKKPHYIILSLVALLTLLVLNLPRQTAGRVKLAIGGLFLPLVGLTSSGQQIIGQGAAAIMPRRELLNQLGTRGNAYRAGSNSCNSLYQVTGGNPLALNWALSLIVHRKFSLDEIIDRLSKAKPSRNLYVFLFGTLIQDLTASERLILTALTEYQRPVSIADLVSATNLKENVIQSSLKRLVMLSLVDSLGSGSYDLPSLTRTYVKVYLKNPPNPKPGSRKEKK